MKESRFLRVGGAEVALDETEGALVLHHAAGSTRLRRWWLNESDVRDLLRAVGIGKRIHRADPRAGGAVPPET
jgi:hypothetical protein